MSARQLIDEVEQSEGAAFTMAVWDNPDVAVLYDINGLADSAPTWFDRTMEYVGEYGIVALIVLMCAWAWWRLVRRRPTLDEAITGFTGLLWAPLAAVIALLVNIPIRDIVRRPRPFVEHKGLDVLVPGKDDYSFVSDHSTMAMALAVGLFMVQRRYGLIGIVLAVLAGFTRVYMGVHYPTDVAGGLALGTAVALLLAPAASWLLTPLVHTVAGTRHGRGLVWAGGPGRAEEARAGRRDAAVHGGSGGGYSRRATRRAGARREQSSDGDRDRERDRDRGLAA